MNNWLDADPPTWKWDHDPEFRSLRVRRIVANAAEAWNRFVATSSRPNATPMMPVLLGEETI